MNNKRNELNDFDYKIIFRISHLTLMIKRILYSVFLFLLFFSVKAQEITKPLSITDAENAQLKEVYKEPFDRKREIVFKNKKYRIYNNYVSGGAGKAYNSGWQDLEFCPGLDFNFHLQKQYFQIGGLLAGPRLGINNCLQLHVCYGYRYERSNYMLAAYGGVAYMGGYLKPVNDTSNAMLFKAVGGYIALQYFYKVKFDYGIGATAFLDVNTTQFLTGIRIELFFSGAYRGVKKHDYAKEEIQQQ